MTTECFEKIIKKDMIHPLTGQKLKEKDIIHLQRVSVFSYSSFFFLHFSAPREELALLVPMKNLKLRRLDPTWLHDLSIIPKSCFIHSNVRDTWRLSCF